jgi:NAD(P)H-hydrate epimerase
MKIVTAEQMREIDRLSTEHYGIPSITLMENAGTRVVEELERKFGRLKERTIAVLCGKGNNGGDGMVVARLLIHKGTVPDVYLFANESELRGDAKVNFNNLKAIGHIPISITG